MARIWVKAGTNDTSGRAFNPPLNFRVQGNLTDKDTPVLVNADGNVTPKLRDKSLVKCKAPYLKEPVKEPEKEPEKKTKIDKKTT